MRRPLGDFVREESCVCGFIVDEYDDGRYAIQYADPDTGEVLDRCPSCGRDLNLRGQGRGLRHAIAPDEEHPLGDAAQDTADGAA